MARRKIKNNITNNSKAQVSLEFLIVIAMGVIAITSLIGYLLYTQKSSIIINESQELLEVLAGNINEIYQTQTGTQKQVIVKFPKNLNAIESNGNLIVVKVNIFGTTSSFSKKTSSPVIRFVPAHLPTQSGLYKLTFKKIRSPLGVEISAA